MAVNFKKTKVHASLMLAFGGSLAFGSAPLFAQQQQQLDRVEVTGSLIKRIDAETAAPLQIITREDIQNSGRTTLQEVLRSVTADSTGSIPTSFTNGFASGSAAVSLRGLGVNSTLVLLNGRRMTTYGLADDGTRNFVDLNTLPLEAVDRIEVLKEGASAIYGADAVGGVVNVILRKSYVGASIGGSYGQTGDSDGNDIRGWGSFGFGDLAKDKYNVFFTLEAQKTDNIWARDRGFIGDCDNRSLGYFDGCNGANRPYLLAGPSGSSPYGVTRNAPPPGSGPRINVIPCAPSDIDPETGLCRFNFRVDDEIQPETERFTFFSKGTMQLTPNMQGYAELGYFQTKSKAQGTLGANNDGGIFVPARPLQSALYAPADDSSGLASPEHVRRRSDVPLCSVRTWRARPRDHQQGLPGPRGPGRYGLWLGLQHGLAVCQKRVKERQLRLHHLRPDAGRAEQRHLPH